VGFPLQIDKLMKAVLLAALLVALESGTYVYVGTGSQSAAK
jgi:Uri superfamily endonuclease